VAFLRARDGWPLREAAGNREVHCEQSFAPFAQPLQQAAGWTVSGQLDDVAGKGRYPLVLVLPPRQREEARALFARALALVADGGRIVACQSNNEGARSGEGDLKQLAGLGGSLTKNHCRVYWTAPLQGQHDADLAKRWSALDAVRPIVGGRFLSRPGVFAWDRIDPASALLAEHLPADLAGRAADLGAGYGYLSRELLERCPKITALDLYEAEQRALALAELNLAPPPRALPLRFLWRTSPPASSRATTSSSATRRSTRRRAPTARTSASASSPWPRRRCAGRAPVRGGQPPPAVRAHPQRQLRCGARGRRARRLQAG
jgi:16S rRNA (guanine1207-N2)-methyltransferase